jgi:uncharacterized repeat protein (TIGR01451 family)
MKLALRSAATALALLVVTLLTAAAASAQSADLAVTKTDILDPVVAGSNLTYTITVTNAGPNNARSVQLTDPVPASTTFVSFTAPPAGPALRPPSGARAR